MLFLVNEISHILNYKNSQNNASRAKKGGFVTYICYL